MEKEPNHTTAKKPGPSILFDRRCQREDKVILIMYEKVNQLVMTTFTLSAVSLSFFSGLENQILLIKETMRSELEFTGDTI